MVYFDWKMIHALCVRELKEEKILNYTNVKFYIQAICQHFFLSFYVKAEMIVTASTSRVNSHMLTDGFLTKSSH
jgi:hypothetical protein